MDVDDSFCVLRVHAEGVAMNGPEPSKLTVVRFDLSGRILILPLPSSRATRNLDEVRQTMLAKVDVENMRASPMKLLDDMWDWRSLTHLYGSIGITAVVQAAPHGFDLSCSNGLKQALEKSFEAKHKESIQLGGKEELLPRYSVHKGSLKLQNGAAVVYERSDYDFSQHAFSKDQSTYYAIPISDRAYLEIGFNLFGGGDPAVQSADWLPHTNAVMQAVLQGMRFEGDWPKLHPCDSTEPQY